MIMKKKLCFSFILISQIISAQLYINEVLISPPGTDFPNEYIELRGVPNSTIPSGTYLITVDGDGETTGNGPGDVEQDIVDLSGVVLGANGYLVLLSSGHPYTVDSDAVVLMDQTDGDLEDQTHTLLLIQTAVAPTTSDDIDTNDDGEPDGVYLTWNILDAIAIADDDNVGVNDEYAYASLVFAEAAIIPTLHVPTGAQVVSTDTQFDYVARIGVSTGSTSTNDETTSDWVAGDIPSGNLPNWFLTTTNTNVIPNSFAGSQLNHIGSLNPSVNTLSLTNNVLNVDVNLYPNPVENILNLEMNNLELLSVAFYAFDGKEVLKIEETKNSSIDISSLSKGIYTLKINTQEGVLNKKIIIN